METGVRAVVSENREDFLFGSAGQVSRQYVRHQLGVAGIADEVVVLERSRLHGRIRPEAAPVQSQNGCWQE